MQLIVDDLVTSYQEYGSGKTVVMLHGWGDDMRTFDSLAKSLSAHYRVIMLDLPGFGKTAPPAGVWGLDEYAGFVASFLRKLDIAKVYTFAGHSNGGAVLIRGLGEGSLVSEKLVLLAAAGIRDTGSLRRMVLKIIAKTGKAATFWLPRSSKKKLQVMLYGAAGSDMLVVPELKETFKKSVRQDVQADARKITVPTLLIYGSADRATPPGYGRAYNSLIENSRLEILDGAGHFVHHDRPTEVSGLMERFLT